jgi:hypothetical protein
MVTESSRQDGGPCGLPAVLGESLLQIVHLLTTGPVLSLIDHETSFGNWYCLGSSLPFSRMLFNTVADMLATLIA